VGNISHELKTPIFSVQGYLHTLLEGGVHDDAINVKYLKRATLNLDRLQDLLVGEVMDDLEFMARDANVKMSLRPEASKSSKVECDREKMRQVFQNLISNAIKHGGNDLSEITIGFYDLDKQILIEIEDNGQGIDELHLNHLFDRFYRVDSARARKHGGSGLGLSIVKHLIEAHDQSITVESTIGQGTIFRFTLPKIKK